MFSCDAKVDGGGRNDGLEPRSKPTKVSVIIPVKNEESSIETLLRGLLAQTYAPAEIVITDGGSHDRTCAIVRNFQSLSPVPLLLIESGNALPGRGRNLAISRARHDWIACIDGGTRPRPDWLAELIAASQREPQARLIYGIAEPVTDTYFTECAAITYVPNGGHVRPFIASSLIHRSAWTAAGGFPEDLRSGEDLLFFRALKAAQVCEANCDTAVVAWELRPNATSTFHRFSAYSRSGMKAGLGRHWQLNLTRLYLVLLALLLTGLWIWPLLFLPPLILLLRSEKRIYQWFRINEPRRLWRELLSPRRVFTVMWIQLTIDVATFYGLGQWLAHDRAVRIKETPRSNHAPCK